VSALRNHGAVIDLGSLNAHQAKTAMYNGRIYMVCRYQAIGIPTTYKIDLLVKVLIGI
jgi:hypothetical protein